MVVGVHGQLAMHAWMSRAYEEDTYEEDAFSLTMKRAAAYGWSFTTLGVPVPDGRWDHNDAGGDWTQDGLTRQLAWFQTDVGGLPRGQQRQRLPVLPMTTVLGDVLHRVGRFGFTGLHTVAPLGWAAEDDRGDLVNAADWLSMTDPDSSATFTVTLSAAGGVPDPDLASGITGPTRERGCGRLTVEPAPGSEGTSAGPAHPPAGEGFLALPTPAAPGGTRVSTLATFSCTAPEWSPDVAAWATEVFIDALKAAGVDKPVLITVSSGEVRADSTAHTG